MKRLIQTVATVLIIFWVTPLPAIESGLAANDSGGASADAATNLERLARAAFGDLSPAEIRLVRTAPTREIAWMSEVQDPTAAINDPAEAASWGKQRAIRAKLIAWLLTAPEAARYVHPSGIGIAGARIEGVLDLSFLTVALPITLVDCALADGINLSSSHLQSLDMRRSRTGPIMADLAVVHGDIALQTGHYGETSMFRTQIGGDLDCSGSDFYGDEPLSAAEATIAGDAVFHDGFTTAGTIYFRLAQIGRSLSFNHARFTGTGENGLNAERATIGGSLYWVEMGLTPRTQLDLEAAHAGGLWDDQQSWPVPGNLLIDHFIYGDLTGGPRGADARLAWLALQPASQQAAPQPYRLLAQVLREDGAEEGATQVDMAREAALTRYGGLGWGTRVWRKVLWATIGYGYRPLRALWWVLLFVAIGTAFFAWGYRARLIAPTEEAAYEVFVRTGVPPIHYPPFSSFIYSLENFLPVVELHQGNYWRPNPRHRRARTPRFFRLGGETAAARMLRWYLWLHILAGWTITPLLFAGLAGLLRTT
jgi:hypothetical protein